MPTDLPDRAPPPKRSTISKLAWFVGLWAASVGVLGLVAMVIRTWIGVG